MSKMSELSLAVKELKRCGEALISISESLADLFSSDGDAHTADQPKAEVPAPDEKPITLEAVRAVLAEKSRAGHTAKVRELLEKHGANKLSEIDPSEYPALLAEAEVLGNG
ncbi:DNA ligase [Syntrophomonas erecta subsp. sporosyntropha]